jgi:large subunit ribosomal protein L3
MKVLIGKKIGMTQVYTENGNAVSATVLDVSNNVISRKTEIDQGRTVVEIGKDKQKKPNKADLGNYKAVSFVPRYKTSIRLSQSVDELAVGKELGADVFAVGDKVDVSGRTKGKGFAGVIKRHNMRGGPRTHGQSDRERAIGSIGTRTIPGRVFKGKRMAGHMGNINATTKNLKILVVDNDEKLIVVSGAVHGAKNSYIVIKSSR